MRIIIIILLLNSIIPAIASDYRVDLSEIDFKDGVPGFAELNQIIEYKNEFYVFGNDETIIKGSEYDEEWDVVHYDFNSGYHINSGVIYNDLIYTFGSKGIAYKYNGAEILDTNFLDVEVEIIKAKVNGDNLYLLDNNKTLYVSNFNKFNLTILQENVEDFSLDENGVFLVKNNNLLFKDHDNTEIIEKLSFNEKVSHIKIKAGKYLIYSDSSFIYEYIEEDNTLNDIGITDESNIETLDITENGDIIGILFTTNPVQIGTFKRKEGENEWQYYNSHKNSFEQIYSVGENVIGIFKSTIKSGSANDLLEKNNYVISTIVFERHNYEYVDLLDYENKILALKSMPKSNFIISELKRDGEHQFYKTNYNKEKSYRIKFRELFTDGENIYVLVDTNNYKNNTHKYHLERLGDNGKRTFLRNLPLKDDIIVDENMIAVSTFDSKLLWSTDQGETWEEYQFKTDYNVFELMYIQDNTFFIQYGDNNDELDFIKFDIETKNVDVLSSIPIFRDFIIFEDNYVAINRVPTDDPNDHRYTNYLNYSTDNGITWQSNKISFNLIPFNKMIEYDDKLFILFQNLIYYTSDFGETVNKIDLFIDNKKSEDKYGYYDVTMSFISMRNNDSLFAFSPGQSKMYNGKMSKITNVKTKDNYNKRHIFPNPTGSKVNIDIKGIKSVSVYNLQMQEMKAIDNIGTNTIEITELPAGVYFLEVEDINGNVYFEKIIKK